MSALLVQLQPKSGTVLGPRAKPLSASHKTWLRRRSQLLHVLVQIDCSLTPSVRRLLAARILKHLENPPHDLPQPQASDHARAVGYLQDGLNGAPDDLSEAVFDAYEMVESALEAELDFWILSRGVA